jgi:hypothetical protein
MSKLKLPDYFSMEMVAIGLLRFFPFFWSPQDFLLEMTAETIACRAKMIRYT